VQLYVQDEYCTVVRPLKELKRFKRISLKPGEKKTITFTLGKDAFSFYDVKSKEWIVEPGDFNIMVGSSSADIRVVNKVSLE